MKLSSPLRRRKILSWLGRFILLGLLGSSLADQFSGAARDDWARFDHKTFPVAAVIGSDTIAVRTSHGDMVVRLIGIDAPASEYWAKKSKNYVEQRLQNKSVTLRLEPIEPRDQEGQLRAYAYLSDIDCLNADLIHDGEVFADRRYAHSFAPQYEMAENESRRRERGLWYGVNDDDMPVWRREWLRARNS
jgi:endonuclease YncB( thermonuclease family)